MLPPPRRQFEDPNGHLAFEDHGLSHTEFRFTTTDEGEYKFCFTAKGAGRVVVCIAGWNGWGGAASRQAGRAWRRARGRQGGTASPEPACQLTHVPRPLLSSACIPGSACSRHRITVLCIADYHTAQNTRISFKMAMGAAAHDWAAVAKKDHLTAIQTELMKLESMTTSIHLELQSIRRKEEQMRNINGAVGGQWGGPVWGGQGGLSSECARGFGVGSGRLRAPLMISTCRRRQRPPCRGHQRAGGVVQHQRRHHLPAAVRLAALVPQQGARAQCGRSVRVWAVDGAALCCRLPGALMLGE